MNNESTAPPGTPYAIKRIGRLELATERADPSSADDIAETLAQRVKTAAAGGGGLHGDIAETITALMDIHDPVARRKMPEAMFDRITLVEPLTPRRGETVHDGALTGLRVEVEDAWSEMRVNDSALLWSRKLRLIPAGPHAERAALAPRNYAFGFWGTWAQSDPERRGGVSPAEAWTTVFEVHGRAEPGDPDNLTMRFMLDSRGGRHYADAVLVRIYDGRTPLRDAIRRCGAPFDPDRPDAA